MTTTRKLFALSLLIPVILCSACSRHDDFVAPAGNDDAAERLVDLDYAALQKSAAAMTYEVAVEGTIDLAAGGTVTGVPASWPEGSGEFAYSILPASVLESSLADPAATTVHVRVLVPVYESEFADPDGAMPMILEPHGLTYAAGEEATVDFSFHPALNPSCADNGYLVFCIDGAVPGDVTPGDATADEADPFGCSKLIRTSIPHHSQWAIDRDKGDGEG